MFERDSVFNTWVIRRRTFSLSKFPDMMSLGEFLQISFPLFFHCTKNSPNENISRNFGSEKVDQDEVFAIKIHCISSQNDPNITHTKNYILGLDAL